MVTLTNKEFTEEHKHLLKVLKKGSKADRLKEYVKQKKELKKEASFSKKNILMDDAFEEYFGPNKKNWKFKDNLEKYEVAMALEDKFKLKNSIPDEEIERWKNMNSIRKSKLFSNLKKEALSPKRTAELFLNGGITRNPNLGNSFKVKNILNPKTWPKKVLNTEKQQKRILNLIKRKGPKFEKKFYKELEAQLPRVTEAFMNKHATYQQLSHDAKQTAAWLKSGIKKIDRSLLKNRGNTGKAYRFFAWGNREFREKNPKINKILNLIANPAVPIPVPGIGVAALGVKGLGGLYENFKKYYKE